MHERMVAYQMFATTTTMTTQMSTMQMHERGLCFAVARVKEHDAPQIAGVVVSRF